MSIEQPALPLRETNTASEAAKRKDSRDEHFSPHTMKTLNKTEAPDHYHVKQKRSS